MYDTTIQVKHIIPPSRLELGYLENIFYATGFKEVFVQNYVRVYMGVEPQWVSEAQALSAGPPAEKGRGTGAPGQVRDQYG